jgi:hypothetical protein
MSGGRFDYIQYRLDDVAGDIEEIIKNSGKPYSAEYLKEHKWADESDRHTEYSDEVLEEFRKGAELIRKAAIYMHEIDWLISGDTGDDSFLERLKEKLDARHK